MTRETLDLNGEWEFCFLPVGADRRTRLPMRPIRVPACWESEPVDRRPGQNRALYRRTFDASADWNGRAVTLKFGAVSYFCTVWVNGRKAGTHEGGYTPFSLRIENLVRPGVNEIEVEVVNPAASLSTFPYNLGADSLSGRRGERFPLAEIPFGKQSWYASASGIWQDVSIQVSDPLFVTELYVHPDINKAAARIRARLSGPAPAGSEFTVKVASGRSSEGIVIRAAGGSDWIDTTVAIPDFALWSPESPTLSEASVQVGPDGDTLAATFGMRKFHTADNKLYLNDREWYMIAALDQDFYPDTIYTPPSDDFLKDQFQKALDMGLNMLRCHIKVPDPRYLHWADRMGLLLWCEIPNWWRLTDKAMERAEDTIQDMVRRDFNHPSLLIWTVVNEDWGTAVRWDGTDRRWISAMVDRVKEMDPTRLVVDNSACEGNYHVKTDIEDFHTYCAIPDQARRWSEWVRTFSAHPEWTFSPWGDDERTGKEPLVLSEFGNWGLPSVGALRRADGELGHLYTPPVGDPWWFRTGGSVTRPEGIEGRFKRFHLDKLFPTYDKLAEASQRHQFLSMKYEIEQMRRYESIKGYVITEFTDIFWEPNGLLDLARNPKAYHADLPMINTLDMVVPLSGRHTYWSGETAEFDVLVSHYGTQDRADCRVRWSGAGSDGITKSVNLNNPGVTALARVRVGLPVSDKPLETRIDLTLEDAAGTAVSRNYHQVTVVPSTRRKAAKPLRLWVHDPTRLWSLEPQLAAAGFEVTAEPDDRCDAALLTRMDDAGLRHLEAGGRALVLPRPRVIKSTPDHTKPEGEDIFGNGSVFITARAGFAHDETGKPWQGNWATSFSWADFKEIFPSLPEHNPLGWPFQCVNPEHVLLNFDPDTDTGDIHAGMFIGWIHAPVPLVAGVQYGKGKALLSCFRLEAAYGKDPAATVMVHDLLDYVTSDRFQPNFDAAKPGTLNRKEAIERAKEPETKLAANTATFA